MKLGRWIVSNYLVGNATKDGGGSADVKKGTTLTGEQFKRLSSIWQAKDTSRTVKASLLLKSALVTFALRLQSLKAGRGEAGGRGWVGAGGKCPLSQEMPEKNIHDQVAATHPKQSSACVPFVASVLLLVFIPSIITQAFIAER